jgi:hypothetical protein
MPIIVTTQDGTTVKLRPTHVQREDVLQRFIHDHPDSLPLDEIRENVRLRVLCREYPTASGPIDALAVDDAGEIYIIETKLFRNPDKRTVIAQALDYGSALWHSNESGDAFLEALDSILHQRGLLSLRDQLRDFAAEPEGLEQIVSAIGTNQSAGKFRFVILMDKLSDRLKDLITFLNENSKFTVYAAELEFYRHEGLEIVLPRLYGAEAKKDLAAASAPSGRRKWDEESFFSDAAAKLDAARVAAIRVMYDASAKWADEISWGTGVTAGSFSPKKHPEFPRAPFAVYSDGRLLINFPYFNAGSAADRTHVFADELQASGFKLPSDYSGRHVTFTAEEWIDRADALERAVAKTLY